ncbi:hypothetical protein WA158_004797 [Blastocystis sp. Blastoise]
MNISLSGLLNKSLREFIRGVRAAKTAAEERSVISKEAAYIRSAFREDEKKTQAVNMSKLLFIHLMGYPAHFGQMESLKLIASPRYSDKRIGYLSLVLLLNEDAEVFLLIVNSIKNDIRDSDPYISGLALTAAGNICSEPMARDIFNDVALRLDSSNPFLKKKACLCLITLLGKVPDLFDNVVKKLPQLIVEEDHGVLISGLSLIHYSLTNFPEYIPKFRKLVPRLQKRLRTIISGGYKSEHSVTGVPDPFLQVEILKLLSLLCHGDVDSSDILSDILALIATKTDSSCMAGNAVLYEAVRCILNIEASQGQIILAGNILGKFLTSSDNNIRYVALSMLRVMVDIDHQAVSRYRNTIIACLKENDISLQRRALELVFALVNKKNVEELVEELLAYLCTLEEEDAKDNLISRITSLVQRYNPSSKWQLNTLLKILTITTHRVNEEVFSTMVSIVGENEDELAPFIVKKLYNCFNADINNIALNQVALWILGEYGDEIETEEEMTSVLNTIQTITESVYTDAKTLCICLVTLLKLRDRFGSEYADDIMNIMEPLRTNDNVEVQQRACEYYVLLDDEYSEARDFVLDRMPILDLFNIRAKRDAALKEDALTEDEYEEEEEEEEVATYKEKPRSHKDYTREEDEPIEDLLGLMDFDNHGDNTNSKATTAKAPESSTLDDIFGTSTISAPAVSTVSTSNDFDMMGDLMGSINDTKQEEEEEEEEEEEDDVYYKDDNISIRCLFKDQGDREWLCRCIYKNISKYTIDNFDVNVSVPKFMKNQAKAPTGDSISVGEEITQLLKLKNTSDDNASIFKLKITFECDGDDIKVAPVIEIPEDDM